MEDLKELVLRGEGRFLEFKKKTDNPEKIVKEMVAFANSGGGVLLVGVSDNGELAGLKNPEGDLYIIKKTFNNHVVPKFTWKADVSPLNARLSVIRISIPESRKKPHYFRPAPGKYGHAYIRIEDQCVRASREVRNLMKMRKYSKGTMLRLGESEQAVLKAVDKTGEITLNEAVRITRFPKRKTSALLVKLAATGILSLEPRPGDGDVFRVVSGL